MGVTRVGLATGPSRAEHRPAWREASPVRLVARPRHVSMASVVTPEGVVDGQIARAGAGLQVGVPRLVAGDGRCARVRAPSYAGT